ncbi:rho guanine nucleotide exchange factor 8-like [Durio zibethinus]|uniref:Rho guanine nucleotide exchange factor 8-like n=1 Tax=Durio zibethinus TaxID=66656 RepID=A0A6P5ZHH8_DURZI|nr:rho guanine nucleotide exchange factor 8-like [Durio zibethinus]
MKIQERKGKPNFTTIRKKQKDNKQLALTMVRTLTRRCSIQSSGSFRRMLDNPGRQQQNLIPGGNDVEHVDDNQQSRRIDTRNAEDQSMENQNKGEPPQERPQSANLHMKIAIPKLHRVERGISITLFLLISRKKMMLMILLITCFVVDTDMEQMKERFAKLLLGEDMSGGGKGVSSALALSNAVTNLAASIFGEQGKLEPMAPERKARWRKEMDWLLSVTDHIVEFVPSQQKSKDGTNMEIMVTKQRSDLLVNIPGLRKLDTLLIETLDNFGQEKEFWYVSKNDDQENENSQRDGKWWHPTVKVPANGLSETSRRWLQSQKESVSQVLKAAMAINAEVLSEIEIPESYIDSLPKNGRASLGDSIYKSITVEYFDPAQFLSTMDLSTEHKVLDLKNRIEASIIIWNRKMHQKDGRSSWGSGVSLEKRELFEERVQIILRLLKQHFPGLPQSALDISKIQENRDVGHAILESYSRILESLAFTVMSRIEDVLHADKLTQTSSPARSDMSSNPDEDAARLSASETPTLSDFMGWDIGSTRSSSRDLEIYFKGDNDRKTSSLHLFPPQ